MRRFNRAGRADVLCRFLGWEAAGMKITEKCGASASAACILGGDVAVLRADVLCRFLGWEAAGIKITEKCIASASATCTRCRR